MKIQYISDQNGNTISVVIPIHDWENIKKKYEGIEAELEFPEPTKEEIKKNIKQGLKEVQLIEQGKMKATPLKDFLNEL
jgi:hypothetical protein